MIGRIDCTLLSILQVVLHHEMNAVGMRQCSIAEGKMHMNAIKPETSSLHDYRVVNLTLSSLVSCNNVLFLVFVNHIDIEIVPYLGDLI